MARSVAKAEGDQHKSPGQLNILKDTQDKMLSNASGVSSGTGPPRCLDAVDPQIPIRCLVCGDT